MTYEDIECGEFVEWDEDLSYWEYEYPCECCEHPNDCTDCIPIEIEKEE